MTLARWLTLSGRLFSSFSVLLKFLTTLKIVAKQPFGVAVKKLNLAAYK